MVFGVRTFNNLKFEGIFELPTNCEYWGTVIGPAANRQRQRLKNNPERRSLNTCVLYWSLKKASDYKNDRISAAIILFESGI